MASSEKSSDIIKEESIHDDKNLHDFFYWKPKQPPPRQSNMKIDKKTPKHNNSKKFSTSTPIISQHHQGTPGLALTPIQESSLTNIFNSRYKSERSFKNYRSRRLISDSSQIDITPENTFNFKIDSLNEEMNGENITTMSLEIFAETRGNFEPDPNIDRLLAVFYSVVEDGKGDLVNGCLLLVDNLNDDRIDGYKEHFLYIVDSEECLLKEIIEIVRRYDPDILIGYEIENLSWGYLLDRSKHLNINLTLELSRVPFQPDYIKLSYRNRFKIIGRIVLNLWRVLRHELTLNIYNFENVYFHVIHKRVAKFEWTTLTSFWKDRNRWRVLDYFQTRTAGNLLIIQKLNLISQTSELARVFGIEFFDVLNRGSQYRVESMMLRVSRAQNFIAASPSVAQRARQKAPECIPLTLEPVSNIYYQPVIVLDFQSLYPSIMIAYNYCFTTCIGRLNNLIDRNSSTIELGCCQYPLDLDNLIKLYDNDQLFISPNNVVFVKETVQKGIISDLVADLLDTRIMVKNSLKDTKIDKTHKRILQARQLGLKLAANTTYGYTAASFSGRMPCVEVADAIVQTARKTLEKSIELVKKEFPNVSVLYGDTDSMFILAPGTIQEAFKVGKNIVDRITCLNPNPIKLKLEKVYAACVLQTKKRYAGLAFESCEQVEPILDCKGIETIRRDSCPVASKILKKSLNLLLKSTNLSIGVEAVRKYILKQCAKVLGGRINIQEFIIAKEYRGSSGYKPSAHVPSYILAKRRLEKDIRSEPKNGERVPYVVINGPPGSTLKDTIREPLDLINDSALNINFEYYLTKMILPPLNRIFSLVGIDVFSWYQEIPRKLTFTKTSVKGTISQFFGGGQCPICSDRIAPNLKICKDCSENPCKSSYALNKLAYDIESDYSNTSKVCQTCTNSKMEKPCTSIDCPILFRFNKFHQRLQYGLNLKEVAENL